MTLLLLAWLAAAGQAPAPASARWALVVGENQGLSSEEKLRFAESDARHVLEALQQVGGVTPERSVALYGADPAKLRAALAKLLERLAAEGQSDDRLVVYVSSHAGEGALHLKGGELPLAELAAFLKAAPVSVGLLVVDACRSGGLTRLKGLKPVDEPPVRVEASELSGRVFISASGADEYAQESDELGGSTFTHHWVAALRGAADASRDGRVTLEEAYTWAWARTLESTFASRGGMQRPAFKVDLRGQGELVLTELGGAPGLLTLESTEPGRWLVVSALSGTIVAEVEKSAGKTVVAVPPGEYRVRLRVPDGYFERQVSVPAAGAIVRATEFREVPLIRIAAKGAEAPALLLSAGVSLGSGLVSSVGMQLGAEFKLRREGALLGPVNQVSLVVALRDGRSGAAVTFRQMEFELRLGAGHRWRRGSFAATLALELGAVGVWQSDFVKAPERFGLEPTAVVCPEVRYDLDVLSLYLGAQAGAALVKKEGGTAVVARFGGGAGVAISF